MLEFQLQYLECNIFHLWAVLKFVMSRKYFLGPVSFCCFVFFSNLHIRYIHRPKVYEQETISVCARAQRESKRRGHHTAGLVDCICFLM